MPLSRDTFQKLIDLFTPYFETLDQRRTLVGGAFFGTDVLAKVQLEGTSDEFTTRTVQMLIQHGEVEPNAPAIIRLMQQLRGTIGVDKQAEIDALIDTIYYELANNPAKPTGKPRVFISYSRADGEEFATDLRKRLEAENLTLWQDRARMEGGVGWWKQITDALDAVEFMVLVATPAAIASAVVKKEWRYARQQGVCVYPVQVPGLPLDFPAMPKWMRDSHFYNLDHEWETFVNYLKAPCTVPKVPFMAPDLPEHFVPRPEKFDLLKRQLLDADFDNPVAITTALKGAGGFGKTTLAAALCHDEDVQTAFDEGVLWVTLGENPNIINKLTVLYRALTDENPGFIEIEEGANKLAEKLVDADVLLVIDDVWNPAHLRPFLRGGERVARLVTTRFSNIVVDANADLLEVDEMTIDESVQMLLAGIEPPEDLTPFEALAERLGEWALMLEVTNGTLRKRMVKGADLDSALAYVNKALDKRGVAGLKTGSNEAAIQVLDTSIAQLDQDIQPRLFELAIFAEDTDVPLTSIMALWGMDDFDTEELIDQFDDLSFVRFDAERGVIRLHDVVREVLESRLDDPMAVHAGLIENYGDLTDLPDGYAWQNIAYHLTAIDRTDILRDLMLDLSFIDAKLTATNPVALSTDAALLEKDDPIMRIMRSFWQVSAHVLSKPENHHQLYNQLLGRLGLYVEHQTSIRDFLEVVRNKIETRVSPALILQQPSLDPAGGILEKTLNNHRSSVYGAIELRNGKLLSWSNDTTLRLWSSTGEIISVLEGHIAPINKVKVLKNGRILSWATTYHQDYTIRLWSETGTPLAVMNGHSKEVNGVLETSNGQILSWSDDKTLRLWTRDGDAQAVLTGHKYKVAEAVELDDSHYISWAKHLGQGLYNRDFTLQLWNERGTPVACLQEHKGAIIGVLRINHERFLSWSFDKTLRLWSTQGEQIGILEGHKAPIRHAILLKHGEILSWSMRGANLAGYTLRLWSNTGKALAILEGHKRPILGATELTNGQILSWSEDKTLRLWSSTGKCLSILEGHDYHVVGALELDDSRILSWGGNTGAGPNSPDNTLRLWSSKGEPLGVLEGHSAKIRGVLKLATKDFVSWSNDGTIRLWSNTGEVRSVLKAHPLGVSQVLKLKSEKLLSWSSNSYGGGRGRRSLTFCARLGETTLLKSLV